MKQLNKLKKHKELLFEFQCGLERETLRISKDGKLSQKPHPIALGSPLTHPYFSTDFGEAQLEWNTPPLSSFVKAKKFLHDLMAYAAQVNSNELFWPYSMPCELNDNIQIARYGSSNAAREKELYRKGLCYRYGKKLQMISSLHFNFSFSQSFWDFFYDLSGSKKSMQSFINDSYFKIIRNFLCEGWLLTYLFGASPAMHESYIDKIPQGFTKKGNTLIHPDATSIRMSYLGYYSRIQDQLTISFKDLDSYLKDMKFAISTPCPLYQKIGTMKNGEPLQINDHFLQIENEHYARIRPKRNLHKGESPLSALKTRGVEYLEVRAIDINPFDPLGLTKDQFLFLHQFLLYCLLKESSTLNEEIRCSLIGNQQKVALLGRQKGLLLQCHKPIPLQEWAARIFKHMEPISHLLGPAYVSNLNQEQAKLKDASLTPSAQVLKALKNETLEAFGLKWAKKHQKEWKSVSPNKIKRLDQTVLTSLQNKQALETASEVLLEGHETLELSTQILMKEALKHGIEVEVLDPSDNFIRLKKGEHIEYVKQATKTSQDTYIASLLMENKHLTKVLLREHGFSTPDSHLYHSIDEAYQDYPLYEKKKIVVKPKSTNFGIGITFVKAHDKKGYHDALKEAFQHGYSILVETFHSGKEYRFLVIDEKVEGVIYRIPAHVIGDGIHTIKELVHLKNHDPSYYRHSRIQLRLTKVEIEKLRSQRLTPNSILPKNKKVFLRENSNVSTGGDAIDVTDDIHPSYFDIATAATKAIGAKICGLDILLSFPHQAATQKNHSIIELNFNPVLYFHAFPNEGKKRNVAEPVLKLLGFK
ncbi:glutamate--cysteine ligase [Simkania negevensis]|uniref:Glutamate--cysteine ligase n=1 Tax=Simkania negevensis (strain ATCC VR-1471 / DSM 27360 / Z) TaxID=331113 RepID=F8L825_SIMNZ|nr:glutamate--cysteine ligase [Simkania negevensis]CCB88927.1 glutathione biosynthesis bifunctional protein gshAB [Simkania negevensis Z]